MFRVYSGTCLTVWLCVSRLDPTGHAGGSIASSAYDHDDGPVDAEIVTDTNADVNHDVVLTQPTYSNHINTTR